MCKHQTFKSVCGFIHFYSANSVSETCCNCVYFCMSGGYINHQIIQRKCFIPCGFAEIQIGKHLQCLRVMRILRQFTICFPHNWLSVPFLVRFVCLFLFRQKTHYKQKSKTDNNNWNNYRENHKVYYAVTFWTCQETALTRRAYHNTMYSILWAKIL